MKCPRCKAEVGVNPKTNKLFAHTKTVNDPDKLVRTPWGNYGQPQMHAEVCE